MNFYVLFVMGFTLFVLALFKFNESKPAELRVPLHLGATLRRYGEIIKNFDIIGYAIISAIQFGGLLTVIQLCPFIFQDQLGFSPAVYGWLIFVVGFGSLIGSFISRFVSQHFELMHIIYFAVFFSFIFAVVMNVLAIEWFNAWVIVIPILLIRFFGGLTYSNCIAQGVHQAPERAGSMSALFGMIIVGGGSLISFVVAHLPQYKQLTLSGVLAIQLLFSLGVVTLLYFRKRGQGAPT